MTAAVVDLVAVHRARGALAALVHAHPDLTSAAARERLAAAIPDLLESTMSNRLDPAAQGPSTTVGVRLSPDLLAAVDREVERLTAGAPYRAVGRSDAVRSMLLRCMAADARAAAPPPTAAPPAMTHRAPSPVPAKAPARATEGPCETCGEGLWHGCTRGCGRRTRTCLCAESVAADGVCETCAKGSAVDLVLAPPKPRTVKAIAPDDTQESARAEVRAWLARDAARIARDLAPVAGTADQNLRRWLNPNRRQRLPADVIDRLLAHVKAQP